MHNCHYLCALVCTWRDYVTLVRGRSQAKAEGLKLRPPCEILNLGNASPVKLLDLVRLIEDAELTHETIMAVTGLKLTS